MPRIIYIEHGGAAHAVEAKAGLSVMEAAVKHGVPGIDADCGGACACATCHVYLDAGWLAKVGARTAMEASMLDFAEGADDNSRLACQIRIVDDLDGLVVRLPQSQH